MKRFLAVLMLVVMMCGCVGLAEEQKFDYTVLEKLDGYSYDKFEKAWSYYGAYAKKYSDARLVIGVQVDGDKDSVQAVVFYAKVVDTKNETYSTVEEVSILADDTLITCKLMPTDGQQTTLVLKSNADALQAIVNAKEISFKVKMKIGSVTLEPTMEDLADFIAVIKTICEYNILSYSTNLGYDTATIQILEKNFPITVEK